MKALRRIILSRMNKRGIYLPGMIIGSAISSLLIITAMEVFVVGNRYFAGTQTQVELQNQARLLTMQFARTANRADNAEIYNNGDRIEFDANGVISKFELVGNNIVFTPDINSINSRTFLANVIKYQDEDGNDLPLFARAQNRNNLVHMRMRFQDTNGTDGPQYVDIDMTEKMRNAE